MVVLSEKNTILMALNYWRFCSCSTVTVAENALNVINQCDKWLLVEIAMKNAEKQESNKGMKPFFCHLICLMLLILLSWHAGKISACQITGNQYYE